MVLNYSGSVPGLKGLLEFVRLDLDTLREGALLDLRHDLILFTVGIGASFQLAPEELTKPLLRQLQRDLRDGLHTMKVDGMRWPLPQEPRGLALEPPVPSARNRARVSSGPRLTYDLKPFRGAFLAAAVQEISKHWDDIRPCPQCGSFFLRVRRQKYCSPECRWNAFAPKRPERDYESEYQHRRRVARQAAERDEKRKAAARRRSR